MAGMGDERRAAWRDDGGTGGWAAPFLPDDDAPRGDGGYGGGQRPAGMLAEDHVAWYVPLVGRLLMLFAVVAIVGAMFGGLTGIGVTMRDTLTPAVLKIDTPNPTIEIENAVGAIRVLPGNAGEVRITQTIEVRHLSSNLAQQGLEAARIAPPVLGTDGVVRIVSRPKFDVGFFFHRDVDTVIYVPPTANLRLNVEAGGATVERASGRIEATVSGGNLELLGVKIGDGSTLTVNAGNALLDGELLPGASFKATVNAGNATLTLPRETAARFSGTVNSGNLSVEEWTNIKPDALSGRRQGATHSYSGYLYTDQGTQGQITVVVNSGNIGLHPRASGAGAAPGVPPVPSVPPVPTIPAPPNRPAAP